MDLKKFNSSIRQFFGKILPERFFEDITFSNLSSDAEKFINRTLTLMVHSGFFIEDFSPLMVRQLTTIVPNYLPSAWGGKIPPLTASNRHSRLDDYVRQMPLTVEDCCPLLVDLGCGIPPVTTQQTAKKLKDWQVIGVDKAFSEYVLFDRDGNYACFDQDGQMEYLQTALSRSARALNADPEKARQQFREHFSELHKQLGEPQNKNSTSVENNGIRLVQNHIYDFESENLSFFKAEIGEAEVSTAQVVRCMNVLLYYTPKVRQKIIRDIKSMLREHGRLISGTNNLLARSNRYIVYEKSGENLKPIEFAFSLDNLRPTDILPWFTIQEIDPEASLLARLMNSIRSNRVFWYDFSRRVDVLQQDAGIYSRQEDGFMTLCDGTRELSPQLIAEKVDSVWENIDSEGYAEGAIESLLRDGYSAWKNEVGDIAVTPPESVLY